MSTNTQTKYNLIAYPLDTVLPFPTAALNIEPTFSEKEKFGWGYNFLPHQQYKKAIIAMLSLQKLHSMGYKTFAIITLSSDLAKSFGYYHALTAHCNLIYFRSSKTIEKSALTFFIRAVLNEATTTCYFEDNLLYNTPITREKLPAICLSPNTPWLIR